MPRRLMCFPITYAQAVPHVGTNYNNGTDSGRFMYFFDVCIGCSAARLYLSAFSGRFSNRFSGRKKYV